MQENSREGFDFEALRLTDCEANDALRLFRSSSNAWPHLGAKSFHPSDVVELDFPNVDKGRSRKVISRSNSRPTIKYPSWKVQRMVHCESVHELNAAILLDADTSVVSFREQPCKIKYKLLGEERCHYPDFLVEKRNSKELWEVKADVGVVNADIIHRSYLLQNKLPNFGFEYRLICGKTISNSLSFRNAKYLTRYGKTKFDDPIFDSSRKLFLCFNRMQMADFKLPEFSDRSFSILARLILEGFVDFDRTRVIDKCTEIRWVGKDYYQEWNHVD